MHTLAPGQTGGLAAFEPPGGSFVHRIRAAWRLGFFVFAALAGCVPPSPYQLAATADEVHHTNAFTWLVTHEPSALVVWRANPAEVRAIFPNDRILAAGSRPCAQAKAAHAELMLVARVTSATDRDSAEDCGFALYRDGGAIVSAPR